MNEPIETQIQPPLVTGAERPYTLADAAIDSAKRILIHAETCPEHVVTLQTDGLNHLRVTCRNCGGAEPLPNAVDFQDAWLARVADETALIKAKIITNTKFSE